MVEPTDEATPLCDAASAGWRPSPLLRATAALHAAAAVALVAAPRWRQHWRWIAGALALNHAAVCAAGMAPRSRWLGPALSQLPTGSRHVALTFDDGPDAEVTPRVLDLLDTHGARASFFCIAQRAERLPALTREIVRRGHRLENHTYSHPNSFAFHGPRTMAAQVDRAQDVLTDLGGRPPGYFRAPAGIRNPWLDPILHRRGLTLAAWTRRGFDTVERDPRRVERRLQRDLAAGDILLLHDTAGVWGARRRTAADAAIVLDVLPGLLTTLATRQLRAVPLPDTQPNASSLPSMR